MPKSQVKKRRVTKWEMATPSAKRDSLISSQQFKNLLPFNVSYDVDKHINMNFLMGWEYGRLWFKELHRWEAMNYGSSEHGKNKELFRRKTVIRVAMKRKTRK